MTGTVLENLSARKLTVLTCLFIVGQIVCFLVGELVAPQPSSAPYNTGTLCHDPTAKRTRWLYPRGVGSCNTLQSLDKSLHADNIVFAFQVPHPKDNIILDFTRWQQNLIGILQLEIEYSKESPVGLGIHLVTIYQNGGYTKVWFAMKTIFTIIVAPLIYWFRKRVQAQGRPLTLLEKMILALALALQFLNVPVEWFTLYFDMPYMLLVSDIRQVFTGEHLLEASGERNKLKTYWKHLSAVVVGCLALFLFDLCERGAHLVNPFYSLWATPVGRRLALTLIIAAGVSASLYFIFLSWTVWKVFRNIRAKGTSLPAMSAVRRLHYQGIIYRFKFLMLTTLICAAMTVIGFILGQVTEDKWKWEGVDTKIKIEYTSAFYTGVYGMWNIYISALLCLYAPFHKRWPPERDPCASTNSQGEEIEFSRLDADTTEISALASFAKKAATD